jgi:tyrosine-protein kinase Etk/Wzc
MGAQGTNSSSGTGQMRSVNVLDALVVLARHKRLIIRTTFGVLLISVALYWLVIPRWYKSTASVMPPKQRNMMGLLSAVTRTVTSPLRNLGLGGGTDEISQFQTILASRRALEALVDSFGLQEVYRISTREETMKELTSNISVEMGKEDVSLDISVYDTDRNRAAAMANYLVETLNRIYMEMSVSEARSNRQFLERRYNQNMTDLEAAENDYKAFQEKYGAYAVPEQVKAAVQAAAQLKAQITLKEIQLGILERSTTDENPETRSVRIELNEMQRQMNRMVYGSPGEKGPEIFAPFAKTPEIGLEYLRHYREVEIQGKLLELLFPLYEQARIEEQRDTPSVLILDNAIPAEKASRPKRLIITLLATLGAFVLTCIAAFVWDAFVRMQAGQSDADQTKINLLRQELRLKRLFR